LDHRAELSALCSLDDPVRAGLYDYVAGQDEPVSRQEAADGVGVDRSTAAYHLDKLVEQGLLTTSFARPSGRGGPGAGRPAKHYEASQVEVGVTVPPRDYRVAAELLARAIAGEPSARVRRALETAARDLGGELAATAAGGQVGLAPALEALGYRPSADGDVIRLRNCPFHRLAQEHTELICGMNVALMSGLAAALGDDSTPVLDPAPDRCCVAFHPSTHAVPGGTGGGPD
jgi:predicted ArsR family transcriptional regulator